MANCNHNVVPEGRPDGDLNTSGKVPAGLVTRMIGAMSGGNA